MTPRQSLVAIAGAGLVGVNYWTSSQRTTITATVWDKRDPAAAHKALLGITGELLLVGLLVLFAGTDAGASASLAILAALFVLWGIQYYGGAKGGTATGRVAGAGSHGSSQGAGGGARREV